MRVDVEAEMNRCAQMVGGCLISSIVGKSPNFSNADYLFDAAGVVAELKCLSKDQIRETPTIDKMSKIYQEALAARATNAIIYGQGQLGSDDLSRDFAQKIYGVYRGPLQNVVNKANSQIKQTKDHLVRPGHVGLLILVNDYHTALNPSHVKSMLGQILSNRAYSSINSVLFLTANLVARHPDLHDDLFVWVTMNREDFSECPASLLLSLREVWFARHQQILGRPISTINASPAEYSKLSNAL